MSIGFVVVDGRRSVKRGSRNSKTPTISLHIRAAANMVGLVCVSHLLGWRISTRGQSMVVEGFGDRNVCLPVYRGDGDIVAPTDHHPSS
jgi:hypothetical protein